MAVELSVVLVNYNGADCLPATLAALRAGTRAEHEIIVVDSASTDGSWQGSGRGRGCCASRRTSASRRAATAARRRRAGDFVAFVNFDASVEDGWDEPLLALLRDDPGVAVATGLLVTPDGATLEAVGLAIAPNTATYGRLEGLPRAAAPSTPIDVVAASGALTVVRRDGVPPGFDELIWMYGEEADYALRVLGADRRASRERDPARGRPRLRAAAVRDAAVLAVAQPADQRRAAPPGRRRWCARWPRRSRSTSPRSRRCARRGRPERSCAAGATACA